MEIEEMVFVSNELVKWLNNEEIDLSINIPNGFIDKTFKNSTTASDITLCLCLKTYKLLQDLKNNEVK